MTFQVPHISQAEIESFHSAHFSSTAIASFSADFIPAESLLDGHHNQTWPREHSFTVEEYYYEEEDDGLGYYADGVKRTLTDEQIEIFRHSELESLRRVEEKAAKLREQSSGVQKPARVDHGSLDEMDDGEVLADDGSTPPPIARHTSRPEARPDSEDGELDEDVSPQYMTEADAKREKKKRARQRKKDKSKKFYPEPKPDLRKRTWDVVEAGMDSLDYDGFDGAGTTGGGFGSKRRHISYDD